MTEIADRDARPLALREVFTRFELRDPLSGLEEALGEQEAAPRAEGERRIEATLRETTPAGIAELGDEAALVVVRDGEALRWAAHDGGEVVLAGPAASLAEVLEAWGDRGLVAHDWKTLATRRR